MNNQPNFDRLFEIAEDQAGYFTASQAQEAGFSWERLSYYVSTGRFSRIQRGIYRLVQFPGSPFEDLFVAWLKTGPDAVISHDSALHLYGLSDVLPSEIHVIMPRTGSRRRKGIRLHTNRLNTNDITRREGLPVTSTARTIVDVAASGIAEEQVRKAVRDAIHQGLVGRDELLNTASRRNSRILSMIQKILDIEAK
jgi:predicted transcriptional regulator of viral defense system